MNNISKVDKLEKDRRLKKMQAVKDYDANKSDTESIYHTETSSLYYKKRNTRQSRCYTTRNWQVKATYAP